MLLCPSISKKGNGKAMEDHLMTVQQVADWLQMDPATVQRMIREGILPGAKIGRTYRFRKTDLAEWFDRMKNGTGEAMSQFEPESSGD